MGSAQQAALNMSRLLLSSVVAVCLASLFGQISIQGATGDADLTFDAGSGGIARLGNTDQAFSEIIVLPDDKILLGGAFTNFSGTSIKGLMRLTADGTYDSGFAANLNLGIDDAPLPPYVTGLQMLSEDRILFTCAQLSNINGTAASPTLNLSPSILLPDGSRD